MKKILLSLLISIGIIANIYCQTINYKEEAIKASKIGDFSKAIELLNKAKVEHPNDPDIYYYLGVFMHYQAYDSTPFVGYDSAYAAKVLYNLGKAIKLKPDYGNAFYFIGSQYSGLAIDAMQNGNVKEYKTAYKTAYKERAFPAWLVEYDRNLLKSCDSNAILFVGGDAEYNPIQYLQVVKNFRRDITVIPFGLLDRPWYVKCLKKGLNEILKKIPISISKKQIMDMHPYKWDTLMVNIPIINELKKKYHLTNNDVLKWQIVPDLASDNGTFLSAKRAILLNIIQTNKWERPIYFSLGCWPSFYDGLDKYFQLSGLAFRLLPLLTDGTKYKINPTKIEELLLDRKNINKFQDVNKNNIPKLSSILVNYYVDLYQLAAYLKRIDKIEEIKKIKSFIKNNLITDAFQYNWNVLQMLDELLIK